ncbi:MAG: hypothetical protein PHC80_03090, partial [Eubacteriales bacterium]|nr:hypothetical protein [Eubacteriales bacterium]
MKPIVSMRMLGEDTLLLATRVHDNRLPDAALGMRLLMDGVAHVQRQAPYSLPQGKVRACTPIEYAR